MYFIGFEKLKLIGLVPEALYSNIREEVRPSFT